jgi:hypothetical protein
MICTAHPVLFGCETKGNDMGQLCSTYGLEERCIRILLGKSKERKKLGKHRRRRKDNIKMDLQGFR